MVGIGAVNCREQWGICSNMGIQSYPTLLFFHEPGVSVCVCVCLCVSVCVCVCLYVCDAA